MSSDLRGPSTGLSGIAAAAARNLGWLLASRGVLAVLSFFYLGFAAHTLGLRGFGRFALISGASQALATFVAFQTWQIIVQYGVAALHADDTPRLARLLRACAFLDLYSAIVGCLLSVLILSVGAEWLGTSENIIPYALGFAVIQVISIRSTPLGILRLRDRFSLSALADSVTPVMRFVGAVAAMFLNPTVGGFLIAWAVAEVLTAATYWTMVWRTGDGRLLRRGQAPMRAVIAENPGIVRFALSVNATSTLMLSSKQIPLLLVGATIGPAAAGAFRLAVQLAQGLTKLAQLISRAAFPELVRAVRVLSAENLRRIMLRSFLGGSVAALVIMALVVLLGKFALRVIGGSDFVVAYPALIWLAAAGCLDLVTAAAESAMTALHRVVGVLVMRAVGVIALFAVAAPLVPRYGVTAVAIGVFAGAVITAALLARGALKLESAVTKQLPSTLAD